MATTSTTGLYEFDPYGNSPDNLIVDEGHALQVPGRDDYYFIIPKAAPFFASTLEVKSSTGMVHREGVDYLIGHTFVEATHQTGKVIAGSIRFLRRDITGMVYVRYQTLGGEWGFDDNAVLQELSNKLVNPLIRSWDQINTLPHAFPPVPHDQSVDEIIGFEEVTTGLEDIRREIEAASAGATQAHVMDRENPHQVTKYQVNLGLVENYPVASVLESTEATRNDRYMTPARTRVLVSELANKPIDSHLLNVDNPHQVTKAQVGLGLVENYGKASLLETILGDSDELYTTPRGIREVIRNTVGDDVSSHFTNRENPHQVTKAQVGLGNVNNYKTATVLETLEGASTSLYTTPNGVRALVEKVTVGSGVHLSDYNNPHRVTPALIGAYDIAETDDLLTYKLGKDDKAADSGKVYGLSKLELLSEMSSVTVENSGRLEGKTLDEIQAELSGVDTREIPFGILEPGDHVCLLQREYIPDTVSHPVTYIMGITGSSSKGAVLSMTLGMNDSELTISNMNNMDVSVSFYTTVEEEVVSVWAKVSALETGISLLTLNSGGEFPGIFYPDLTPPEEGTSDYIRPSLAGLSPTSVSIENPVTDLTTSLTDAFVQGTNELS